MIWARQDEAGKLLINFIYTIFNLVLFFFFFHKTEAQKLEGVLKRKLRNSLDPKLLSTHFPLHLAAISVSESTKYKVSVFY